MGTRLEAKCRQLEIYLLCITVQFFTVFHFYSMPSSPSLSISRVLFSIRLCVPVFAGDLLRTPRLTGVATVNWGVPITLFDHYNIQLRLPIRHKVSYTPNWVILL